MTEPLKHVPRVRAVSPTRTQETVRVIYGVHSLEVNIAGRSVGEVRAALKQALNIGPQAVAVVDGREILESHILQEGEILEFVRLAGEKGSGGLWSGLGDSIDAPYGKMPPWACCGPGLEQAPVYGGEECR